MSGELSNNLAMDMSSVTGAFQQVQLRVKREAIAAVTADIPQLEGASEDDDDDDDDGQVSIVQPPPKFKLPMNVVASLNAYGETDNTAINRAASTYSISTNEETKVKYDIARIIDPVTGRKMNFRLNPRSIGKYKSATDKGLLDMAKGMKLIQEGNKLQRAAYEDLLRYGTVLGIAEVQAENTKRRKLEETQVGITTEIQARVEIAAIQEKAAKEIATQKANIAKISKWL